MGKGGQARRAAGMGQADGKRGVRGGRRGGRPGGAAGEGRGEKKRRRPRSGAAFFSIGWEMSR